MSSSSETAPVKTVQLEGKVIAITGANRGTYDTFSIRLKSYKAISNVLSLYHGI